MYKLQNCLFFTTIKNYTNIMCGHEIFLNTQANGTYSNHSAFYLKISGTNVG